eukprot:c10050_g1_i1 orf=73-393(-)
MAMGKPCLAIMIVGSGGQQPTLYDGRWPLPHREWHLCESGAGLHTFFSWARLPHGLAQGPDHHCSLLGWQILKELYSSGVLLPPPLGCWLLSGGSSFTLFGEPGLR